jgi:hypothetical protein
VVIVAKRVVIPEQYKHLIGEVNDNGMEVTKEVLEGALNKLVALRTKSLAKKLKKRPSKAEIYGSISDEDILRNCNSLTNLRSGNADYLPSKKDVREMSLGLDEFAGYKEEEQKFIQSRLCEYEEQFDLSKPTDKFIARRAVVCEMRILQLEILLIEDAKKSDEYQQQIEKYNTQYLKLCDSLNVLKKQRESPRNKPESNTDTIAGKLKEADKSVADLEKEADANRKLVEEMIRKRKSR